MTYFNHPNASNSDLKEIVARHEGRTLKPANIQAIYDFGTEFHAGITEPHKSNLTNINYEDAELLKAMADTFWKDKMCRDIAMAYDFRREHEFYRKERFGISAKCKTDGDSKALGIILELKGLSVSTYNSFIESVYHLDYDQGASWYLDTASSAFRTYRYELIVGISKIHPDRLFKLLIDRDHEAYKSGISKIKKASRLWRIYGFK